MVNKDKEIARVITLRNYRFGIPMEFYMSNGFEVADVFPMSTSSTLDLRTTYNKVCDKFGSISIDCCSGVTGNPKITVLKNTNRAQHHKYIAVYSE